MPFPQFRVQTLGDPVQAYPLSTVQAAEQPSPSPVPPSSQPSSASRTPLPQLGVQTLGEPVQLHPDSTRHALEQPSPELWLPSSHGSPAWTIPSPHSAPQLPLLPFPSSNRSQSRARPSIWFRKRQT